MNKSELIEAIAASAQLSKADAGRALEGFTTAITQALQAGDTVSLIGQRRQWLRLIQIYSFYPLHYSQVLLLKTGTV